MKLRLSFFSICAMLFFAGALFTSCTQTNTPTTTTTTTAYSDTVQDISGLSQGTMYQFSVTGSSSNTVITGVSAWTGDVSTGTVRVFWHRGAGDTSNVTVNHVVTTSTIAPSNTIVWAPAVSSSRIRLWETSAPASVGFSGLILGTVSNSASISGAAKLNIDLVLATDGSANAKFPFLILEAADQTSIVGAKATDLSAVAYQVKGGLAMNHFSSELTNVIPTTSGSTVGLYNFSDWATITDSSSIVIPVLTADNHYARVEIIPQTASSNHVWGDDGASGKRFIDVNVTYQSQMGLAFAGRPSEVRRGTNTHRLSGGAPIRQ